MPDIFVENQKKNATGEQTAPEAQPVSPNPNQPKSSQSIPQQKKGIKTWLMDTFENKPHMHPFSTFCTNPLGVTFQNQEQDEHIFLLLRRHLITNVGWILIATILLLIPPILNFLLNIDPNNPTISDKILPVQFIIIFTLFYYLVVFAYAFLNILSWFYNISFITNKHVIDIDFTDVVYHNVASTIISKIQDVDYTQSGVFASFFNYGDVLIQTASKTQNIDLLRVPNPNTIVHVVENLMEGSSSNAI